MVAVPPGVCLRRPTPARIESARSVGTGSRRGSLVDDDPSQPGLLGLVGVEVVLGLLERVVVRLEVFRVVTAHGRRTPSFTLHVSPQGLGPPTCTAAPDPGAIS